MLFQLFAIFCSPPIYVALYMKTFKIDWPSHPMFVGSESEKRDPSGHTQLYVPGLFSQTAGGEPHRDGVSVHSSISVNLNFLLVELAKLLIRKNYLAFFSRNSQTNGMRDNILIDNNFHAKFRLQCRLAVKTTKFVKIMWKRQKYCCSWKRGNLSSQKVSAKITSAHQLLSASHVQINCNKKCSERRPIRWKSFLQLLRQAPADLNHR